MTTRRIITVAAVLSCLSLGLTGCKLPVKEAAKFFGREAAREGGRYVYDKVVNRHDRYDRQDTYRRDR